MKSTKSSFFAVLLFGCCVGASNQMLAQSAEDACYSAYTNCIYNVGQNAAAQYQSYQNTWNNSYASYYTALTNALDADSVTYNLNCQNAYQTWIVEGNAATINLYSNLDASETAWYNSLNSPTCTNGADYSFYMACMGNDENYALGNESAGYNYCPGTVSSSSGTGAPFNGPPIAGPMSLAQAAYIYQDAAGGTMNLYDIFNKNVGTAYAVLDKNNTYENFIVNVQYDACETAYGNCMLSADCSENPANCCVDGCAQGYNNAAYSAYASYINSLAGPISADVFALDMAGVNQGWSDSEAYRAYQSTCDQANASYNYYSSVWGDYYSLLVGFDANTAQYEEALCACAGFDCSAAAQLQQAISDASAYNSYTNTVAGLYQTLTNTTTQAYNTLTNAQQQDANTYNSTTTAIDNAMNNLYNSAGTTYNNAMNAASQAYDNCVDGCNGNQG